MWDGVEGADSLVVNAHKWLGAPFDCSLYYVRDPEHLMRVMSTNPSFLQSSVDGQVKNLRDWGIPSAAGSGRSSSGSSFANKALPGYRRLRRDMANARALAETVPLHRAGACSLLSTCKPFAFATSRSGQMEDARRRSSRQAHDGLGRGGEPLGRGLSHAGGTRRALDARVSVGALATEAADVAAVWATMQAAAKASAERCNVAKSQ